MEEPLAGSTVAVSLGLLFSIRKEPHGILNKSISVIGPEKLESRFVWQSATRLKRRRSVEPCKSKRGSTEKLPLPDSWCIPSWGRRGDGAPNSKVSWSDP